MGTIIINIALFDKTGADGPVVQLVRTLACHARGRGFEPHPGRQFAFVAQLVEQRTENPRVVGSIPTEGTKRGFSSFGRAPPCQGGGSEFEPRNPLQKERFILKRSFLFGAAIYQLYKKRGVFDINCCQNIFLSKSIMICCCFGFSADQLSSISPCSGVSEMGSSPSEKNCDKVIPNPLHTLSSVCIVGVCPLRYQVDIVD